MAVCKGCASSIEDWRRLELGGDERVERDILAVSMQLDDTLRMTSVERKDGNILRFRELLRTHLQVEGLPASYILCRAFCSLAIQYKDWDGSTISNILGSVSDFHERLKVLGYVIPNPLKSKEGRRLINSMETDYKKPSKAKLSFSIAQAKRMYAEGYDSGFERPGESPGGAWGSARRACLRRTWHHRMCLLFLTIGMLRMNAASALKVRYRFNAACYGGVEFLPESDVRVLHDADCDVYYIEVNVDADKNVRGHKARKAFIPAVVVALGATPVADFLHYLTYYMTPENTGHDFFLFRAPNGGKQQWYPQSKSKKGNIGGFTNWSKVIQGMYQKAFPGATDAKDFGSHSGRKSLSQWLWDDGYPRRLIADMGGWFIKKDAIDLYFKTSRAVIIRAAMYVGMHMQAGRMHDD